MKNSDEIRKQWIHGPLEGLPEPKRSYEYYFELYARLEALTTTYDSVSSNPNYSDEADRNRELRTLSGYVDQVKSEIEGKDPLGTPIWRVRGPQRDGPYNNELCATLNSLDKSQARPKPLELLAIWRNKPPQGIKVHEKSFGYVNFNGERKEADMDSLRKMIARYTELINH